MQLVDAYRVLGIVPGAPEAEVRHAHDQLQLQWHGDRHAQDPQASQYAYARRAELAVALDLIHRAGFPDAMGTPRLPSYGVAAPPPAPYVAAQGVEVPWKPEHGPLPLPAPPSALSLAAQKAAKRKQATTQILVGIGLILFGAIVTAVTHDAAVRGGGGTYIVAYGPIVIGVVRLFQGLFGLTAS